MSKPVSLKTIVRDFPEPLKTQTLERLLSEARAFVIKYMPRKGCAEYRRKEISFEYGIPKRKMTFVAGRAKAVDLGLAVYVLNQFQPRPSQSPNLAWGDEWDVDEDDPIYIERLPDDLGDAQEAREAALEKLEEADQSLDGKSEPADGESELPLGRLSKPELIVLFEDELGHAPSESDFDGEKVTIARLLDAIRDNRATESVDDDAREDDPVE